MKAKETRKALQAVIWARAVATISVSIMGAVSMYVTAGKTGAGWAILGILIIWSGNVNINTNDKQEE